MMRISAISGGTVCVALLTVSLAKPTAAQVDSRAAHSDVQRNPQAARVERLRKAMSDANTLELLAAQLYVEIGKSRPDTLSVTVTQRTEEIENWRAKSEPNPSNTAIFELRTKVFHCQFGLGTRGLPLTQGPRINDLES
jgi:hypothetical protein